MEEGKVNSGWSWQTDKRKAPRLSCLQHPQNAFQAASVRRLWIADAHFCAAWNQVAVGPLTTTDHRSTASTTLLWKKLNTSPASHIVFTLRPNLFLQPFLEDASKKIEAAPPTEEVL